MLTFNKIKALFITKLTFAEGSNCSSIGEYAFEDSPLTSVCFSNCHNLSQCYPDVFLDCSSLTSVDFSNAINLSSIGDSAFERCSALSSIDLSNCTNLSSIGLRAFGNCQNLTSVSFPKNLSVVGNNAFWYCHNLSSITWNSWDGKSSIGSKAFLGISSTGTIVVTNPSDDAHDSLALLEYLQTVASTSEFPTSGWTAVY